MLAIAPTTLAIAAHPLPATSYATAALTATTSSSSRG